MRYGNAFSHACLWTKGCNRRGSTKNPTPPQLTPQEKIRRTSQEELIRKDYHNPRPCHCHGLMDLVGESGEGGVRASCRKAVFLRRPFVYFYFTYYWFDRINSKHQIQHKCFRKLQNGEFHCFYILIQPNNISTHTQFINCSTNVWRNVNSYGTHSFLGCHIFLYSNRYLNDNFSRRLEIS